MPTSLTSRLENQAAVLGAWMFLREPMAAEVASKAGYDYVCIDMQHGLMDLDMAMTMLAHIDTGDALPVVRATSIDPALIGRLIDSGALGVIVPMVNTVEQAVTSVRACRYAPDGDRSVGPIGAGMRHGGSYFETAHTTVTVIPMIETVESLGNVEAIAAVDGVGALYVGPSDLSLSMGYPEGPDQPTPEFDAALRRVVAACEANGVIPGIHAAPGLVEKRREQGFTMITVGYDYQPMVAGIRNDLERSKGFLGS
jgi:4-hydroxy-2-oxoheptanedioate aldolase